MSDVYVVRNGRLLKLVGAGVVDGGIAKSRFPGDPGPGKLYLGVNNGSGTLTTGDSMPVTLAEEAVFGGTAATRPKFSLVREYSQYFGINSSDKRNMETWCGEGRIPQYSFQWTNNTKDPSLPNFTVEDIANAADSTTGTSATVRQILKANCDFYKTLGNAPVWLTFGHEPQSGEKSITEAQGPAFRKASRFVIQYFRDQGVTNVAWVGPHPVSDDYRNDKFWLAFHPNYLGNNEWTEQSYLNMDGWDPYNPALAATQNYDGIAGQYRPTARTKSFETQHNEYLDAVAVHAANGYHSIPMCIGEQGLYTYQESLMYGPSPDTTPGAGVTPEKFLREAGQKSARLDVVGICLWNFGLAKMNDAVDPIRRKRDGVKTVVTETGTAYRLAPV